MDWKTLFLTAQGRIGKRDFWIGVGILFVISLVLSRIDVLSSLWGIASLYFGVCVYGKRLHDIGKSAWLVLIPVGIMAAAMILAAIMGGAAMMGAAATGSDSLAAAGTLAGLGLASLVILAGAVACFGFVIWLGTRDGEAADNRFGPLRTVPLVTMV